MKSHRIIVPIELHKGILTELHAAHQGTENTKLGARTYVYLRGLNKDIHKITKTCSAGQELRPRPGKRPRSSQRRRQKHGILLDSSECLFVPDYYSQAYISQADMKGTMQQPHSNQNVQTYFQRKMNSQSGKI